MTKEEKKVLPQGGPKGFRIQASCLLPWLLRFFKGLSFLELSDTVDAITESSAHKNRLAQFEAAITISSLLATLSPELVTKPVWKEGSLQSVVQSTASEAGLLLKSFARSFPSTISAKKVDSPARKRSSTSSIPPISPCGSTSSSKSNSPLSSPKTSPSKSTLPQESSLGHKLLSLFSSSTSNPLSPPPLDALAKAPTPAKDASTVLSSVSIPVAPVLPTGTDSLDRTIRKVKKKSSIVNSPPATLLKACTSIVSLNKQLTALARPVSPSSNSQSREATFSSSFSQRVEVEGKKIKVIDDPALITQKDIEKAMKAAAKKSEGKKRGIGSNSIVLFSLHDALLASQRFKMQKEALSGYKYSKKPPMSSSAHQTSIAGPAAKPALNGKAVQRLAMEFHTLRYFALPNLSRSH